jgi:hypothetical protein
VFHLRALGSLLPLGLLLSARGAPAPWPQDVAPSLPQFVELLEPWTQTAAAQVTVERREELLLGGQWTTVAGEARTFTLERLQVFGETQTVLRATASGSRSLLAEGDDASLAHRVAALGDDLPFELLCDVYGVPEQILAIDAFTAPYDARRAALIAELSAAAETAPFAALSAGHWPTAADSLRQTLADLGQWAIPIGYTFAGSEPIEFEAHEDVPWCTLGRTSAVRYRLESFDAQAGRAHVSCDERVQPADTGDNQALRDLAGESRALEPTVVRRSTWEIDLASRLPVEAQTVELRQLGTTGARTTLRWVAQAVEEPR